MTRTTDPRSVGQLLSDLTTDVTDLFAKEIRLLKSEMVEKADQVQTGIGQLTAGAICLLAGLLVLLQALVIALTNAGLGAGWASLAVGGGVALIGVLLLYGGKEKFGSANLAPERTQKQLKHDVQTAKEQVQ